MLEYAIQMIAQWALYIYSDRPSLSRENVDQYQSKLMFSVEASLEIVSAKFAIIWRARQVGLKETGGNRKSEIVLHPKTPISPVQGPGSAGSVHL